MKRTKRKRRRKRSVRKNIRRRKRRKKVPSRHRGAQTAPAGPSGCPSSSLSAQATAGPPQTGDSGGTPGCVPSVPAGAAPAPLSPQPREFSTGAAPSSQPSPAWILGVFGGSGDTPAKQGDPIPLPPAPRSPHQPQTTSPHPPPPGAPSSAKVPGEPRVGTRGWGGGEGGIPKRRAQGQGKHQGPPGVVCEREGSCGTQPTCQHAQGPRVAPHVRVPGGGAVPQGARATSLLVGEGEARLLTCPD